MKKVILHTFTTLLLLLPRARGTLADTGSKTHLSPVQQNIRERLQSIPPPNDGVSDPSAILTREAKHNIAEKLLFYSSRFVVSRTGQITSTGCQNTGKDASVKGQSDPDCDVDGFPVQIAVAIVEELGIPRNLDDDEYDTLVEKYARESAMSLHDRWGIGYEIPDTNDGGENNGGGGGTGVLVFLSVRDRVVFVSTGGALRHILTNGRIDRIIRNEMRPDLKRAEYEKGLMHGIDAIAEVLEKGEEPSVFECVFDWISKNAIVLTWAFFVFGWGALNRWKTRRDQRDYAAAATRLSEIDRARAEALRGTYCPATSCPICLEDFRSEHIGSDGRPIQLLRCGHVFDKTCYEEWVASGRGDVTKCPVCRADVGCVSSGCPADKIRTPLLTRNETAESQNEQTNGDRNNSRSTTTTSIGYDDDDSPVFDDDNANEANNLVEDNVADEIHDAMDLYQRDRNFRLERLAQLYPRYISTEHVTRWSSPSFSGSLARDPFFRNNDPAIVREAHRTRSSGSNYKSSFGGDSGGGGEYSFGGGTSGGGSGGRF